MLFTRSPSVSEFEAHSGWRLEPQGLCQGDICVPFSGHPEVRSIAAALGMPIVGEDGVIAIGPRAADHVLESAQAPPITLPDVRTGQPFELASLKGTKVLLLAWASW